MSKAWQWYKRYELWIYGVVFLGFAAWDFSVGSPAAGIFMIVVALGVPVALWWARSATASGGTLPEPESDTRPVLLQKTDPDDLPSQEWFDAHRAEYPTCSLCIGLGWDKL